MATRQQVKIDPVVYPWDSPVSRRNVGDNIDVLQIMNNEQQVSQDITSVSGGYNLIQNEVAVQVAQDIITRSNMPVIAGKDMWNGKRFSRRWVFQNEGIHVGDKGHSSGGFHAENAEEGDFVALAMDVFNSYDGSSVFGLAFNLQRMICNNLMCVDFKLGTIRFKHVGGNGEWQQDELNEVTDRVHTLPAQVHTLLPVFNQMTEEKVSARGLINFAQDCVLHGMAKGDVASVISNIDEADTEPTMWDVYNGFTKSMTEKNTFSANNVNRAVTSVLMNRYAA